MTTTNPPAEIVLPSDRAATARKHLERASDPGRALALAAESGQLQMTPVLRAIGLDPTNPVHQAALLIADKFGLEPLLKHVVVIPNKGAYVTRDGLLAVAHRHPAFDGIEISGVSETETHYLATASVWRKDMGRPFTYQGRYPKQGGNKQYGPEMAIKCAEVMALRRAFNVAAPVLEEQGYEVSDPGVVAIDPTAPAGEQDPTPYSNDSHDPDGEVVDAELVEPEQVAG